MPKDTELNPDRIQLFADMALALAADQKGAPLTDDEVEEVLEHVGWWVSALAHGMDPVTWADAMQVEAQGKATVH